MKLSSFVARSTIVAGLSAASPAYADFIDFAQFGPTGTTVPSGGAGVTQNGVPFTISDVGAVGFTEYCEDKLRQCANTGYTWAGEFYKDEVILYDNGATSPVTIDFAAPITSLVDLQAQANAPGAFTETLDAYDGATLVASDTAAWFNGVYNPPGEGTIPKLSVAWAGGITSIQISTTNDGIGLALGGIGGVNNNGVPEPSTWAMMGLGFAGLAFAGRRARRSASALA